MWTISRKMAALSLLHCSQDANTMSTGKSSHAVSTARLALDSGSEESEGRRMREPIVGTRLGAKGPAYNAPHGR